MKATARSEVLITPAELAAAMKEPGDLLILVVQSISPYTGKSSVTPMRIPGALDAEAFIDFAGEQTPTSGHRPLPRIEDLQAACRRWGITETTDIILYDNDRSLQAARAWWVLRWAGLTRVRVLDGGYGAWEAAGLELSESPGPARTPSGIELTPGHMDVLDADDCLAFPARGILLDARIRANYIGGQTEPGDAPRGHIPGAINAPAPDNVTDYGNFTDNATLSEIYRSLGVDGKAPVGVYCGAGMSAAHTVLALAALGIRSAMYPGSWSAYITDLERPIIIGAAPG